MESAPGAMSCSDRLRRIPCVDALVVITVLGVLGTVGGLCALLWLRSRPQLRPWVPVAMAIVVGSVAVLAFGLLPPLAFWLMLGAP